MRSNGRSHLVIIGRTASAAAAAVGLALIALPATAQDSLRLFQAEDVFELEYASDPRISPDGTTVVYERRSNDIMTDSTRSNLWTVSVDGERHRPLVSGAVQATAPRWSPSGDRLLYLQSADSGTDVMLRYMDNGQTARLANLKDGPDALSWSPDGRWIAMTLSVKADSEPLAKPRSGPEGSEWSEPVKVFDAVRYKRDGRGFLETAYTHIFVMPADGGTPRQLTSGNFNHEGPLSWTADGQRIVFSANRNDEWEYQAVESDVYAVSVDDGALTRITQREGGESSPVVSPDGRRIAYVFDNDRKVAYRNRVLHVIDLDGSNDRALTTDLDRSVGNVQWAGNSRALFFQFDDRGDRKVARVGLNGDVETVARGLGGTSLGRPYLSGSYTVSANGTVAFTRGSGGRPANVAIAGRRDVQELTALNADLLGNRDLGDVKEILYTSSFDGTPIQGWYITPPGYEAGKAYPTILEIHGGPHLSYGPQFTAELQRMAADGYVVFYNNHRGSTGYGEEFALKLHYKYSSEDDFADHMSGLDMLIERGIADPDQLFITGGSAGGIAAAYAIGLTNRFRAAVVQKPVINWVSKVLTADSYVYQIPYQFPGMPWDELEHYWKRSPLSLVGNVETPTMLITGEEDMRTPISESEQFYQALKLRKIDAVMVRVPGSFHGIAGKPSRLNAKIDNMLAWFARYRDDAAEAADD